MTRSFSISIQQLFLLLLLFVFGAQSAAFADDAKPFADTKLVLQISEDDPGKQKLVLNVASELIKNLGPDQVEIEVVAFGPGLKMLFANNKNSKRIKSLSNNGITFTACSSTKKNMMKKLGKDIKINEVAKSEPGVVRIAKLVKDGYILVKP